mmetsp:Transcript_43130/g.139898  ORF Transcript_43130/g.139898 Transcript_43130/m.139898 type:complete len:201 (-) Transcript_43130:2231-2833(-)
MAPFARWRRRRAGTSDGAWRRRPVRKCCPPHRGLGTWRAASAGRQAMWCRGRRAQWRRAKSASRWRRTSTRRLRRHRAPASAGWRRGRARRSFRLRRRWRRRAQTWSAEQPKRWHTRENWRRWCRVGGPLAAGHKTVAARARRLGMRGVVHQAPHPTPPPRSLLPSCGARPTTALPSRSAPDHQPTHHLDWLATPQAALH